MTDPEITRACAVAMMLQEVPYRFGQPPAKHPESALRMAQGAKAPHWYDPLHNDAQMAAMVKEFRLNLFPYKDKWGASQLKDRLSDETLNPDLNRAVCEYVAKIGEAA